MVSPVPPSLLFPSSLLVLLSFFKKKILTGPSPLAREIRDKFICYVVPMLNPDGVINGNYRCSLAAVDLNRVWDQPSRNLHPTIYHMKELVRSVLSEREVVLFCDIHGHSRKMGSFIYGCDNGNKKNSHAAFE